MIFLVISQRAKANPKYNLKDLPGHGRIDVVFRCILAATRELATDIGHSVYVFLKGSEPHGSLRINPDFVSDDDDEISIAAKIQNNWAQLFSESSLEDLIHSLDCGTTYLLSERGRPLSDMVVDSSDLIVLGAQNDLVDTDLAVFDNPTEVSLTHKSLLASQAIIYLRQQLLY